MHSALATMEATEKASLDLENIWLKKRKKSRQIFPKEIYLLFY